MSSDSNHHIRKTFSEFNITWAIILLSFWAALVRDAREYASLIKKKFLWLFVYKY